MRGIKKQFIIMLLAIGFVPYYSSIAIGKEPGHQSGDSIGNQNIEILEAKHEDKNLTADYRLPLFSGHPQINEQLAEVLPTLFDEQAYIMEKVGGQWELRLKENYIKSIFGEEEDETLSYSDTMSFEILFESDAFISIVFTNDTFLQGTAHPNLSSRVINIDLKNKQVITKVQDLLPNIDLIKLSALVHERLSSMEIHVDSVLDLLDGRTAKTENGLVVILTGDVIPHAFGRVEVKISQEELNNL